MNRRIFASPLLVVVLTIGLIAQGRPGSGGGSRTPGSNSNTTRNPSLNVPASTVPSPLDTRGPTFLSGKVVVDDGTPLTDAALIQSICKGRIRAEGYTDRKGAFSVDLNSNARQMVVTAEENDSGIPAAVTAPRSGSNAGIAHRDMRDCDLQAVLPGFTSQSVELASKVNEFGNAQEKRPDNTRKAEKTRKRESGARLRPNSVRRWKFIRNTPWLGWNLAAPSYR